MEFKLQRKSDTEIHNEVENLGWEDWNLLKFLWVFKFKEL